MLMQMLGVLGFAIAAAPPTLAAPTTVDSADRADAAGARIVIGSGDSFRDDLGIKIHERFEDGAIEALREGRSPSERFDLPRVRVTIELIEPGPGSSRSA